MPGLADRARRRHSLCAEVAVALPAYVAGETALEPRTAQHVAQCLRCQAEVVRYRRMLRTLHDLRDDAPVPPSSVLSDILAQLGADAPGQRTLIGVVAVVALAVGAAGGAGVLLWVARRGSAEGGRQGWTRELQEMATRFSIKSAMTKAMTTA